MNLGTADNDDAPMLPEPHAGLTQETIGACIEVHRELGPGEGELAYESALSVELSHRGIIHGRQLALPLRYKGEQLDCGYRVDVFVADQLPLEMKVVDTILPVHQAQLLTYLRLCERPLGLLVNFKVPYLREGIRRFALSAPRNSDPDLGIRFSTGDGDADRLLAAALEVHRYLGPGLLRSAYEACLCRELEIRGLQYQRSVQLPLMFRGRPLPALSIIPLVVAGRVPVVCLSAAAITTMDIARMLSVLRRTGWSAGFIINFNVTRLPAGIRRVTA